MSVHNSFTICPYSISVLDRKGAATRPTEYFYTPSSSNPSIRKSLGYETEAFPIVCILQVESKNEPQFTLRADAFLSKKVAGALFL